MSIEEFYSKQSTSGKRIRKYFTMVQLKEWASNILLILPSEKKSEIRSKFFFFCFLPEFSEFSDERLIDYVEIIDRRKSII